MERSDLQAWLDAYLDAWRLNKSEAIEDLFTDDAVYRFHPYDSDEQSAIGRAAIVDAWLEEPDDQDAWEAHYEAYAVDGERCVAIGTSRYFATAKEAERVYHNCFLLRFSDDARCAEFIEYYVRVPD